MIRNQVTGGIQYAVVQGQNVTVTLPPRIEPHLTGLPPLEETFTGRDEELQALLAALGPDRERPEARTVSAVAGLPGVGKTELVLHAARQALRTEGWFPGGVLFVDLAGYDKERRVTPEKALDGFLRALGLPVEHIPHDLQDLRRHYTSVLAAYAAEGRRILVVIDNASSAAQVEPLLPGDGVTAVLVTSRHTIGGLGARLHDLDVLTPEAAVDVLRRALHTARGSADNRIEDDPEHARLIAERCGHLPLALQITAALMAERTDRALADFAEDLADAQNRLDELSVQGEAEGQDWAVRSAFALSCDRLDEEQARLFALLSLNAGPDISTEAATALVGREARAARRMLEALFRAHLLARGGASDRWRMHDLVRLYAFERVQTGLGQEDAGGALGRLWEHYRSTAEAAGGAVQRGAGAVRSARFADREAAETWLEREYPNLLGAIGNAEAVDRPAAAAALTASVSGYLHRSRRFEEALSAAVVTLRCVLGERPSNLEAWALEMVGLALLELDRHEEGAAHYYRACTIYTLLDDRLGRARTLDQLGVALAELDGRAEQSEEAFALSLALFRELGDRGGEAECLAHLGKVRYHERRYQEAVELHRQAAELFAETGDVVGRQTAVLLMAAAQQGLEEYAATLDSYEQSIDLYRQLGERRQEGTALEHLGVALLSLKRPAEAERRLREALALWRDLDDLAAQARTLDKLAEMLDEADRVEEAETVLRELVAVGRDLGDRLAEARALARLQTVVSLSGRPGEAIAVGLAAARTAGEAGEPVGEAAILLLLGLDLMAEQRWAEGVEVNGRAVELHRELADEGGEAMALAGLGESLLQLQEVEEAVAALERAAERHRSAGNREPEARVLNLLAFGLHHLPSPRDDDAGEALRRAAQLYGELGDDDGVRQAKQNLKRLPRRSR